MAKDQKELRYCEKCVHVFGVSNCYRRQGRNRYTGVLMRIDTRDSNQKGHCVYYEPKVAPKKPKPTLWQRFKKWWWK